MDSETNQLNHARGNPISSYHLDVRLNAAMRQIPPTTQRLLDIGCGEGYFIEKIIARNPRIRATGIDPSEINLRFARQRLGKVEFLKGKAERLPFKDGKYDCVTCLEVLDHVPDPSKTIGEMRRVLKPDGTLVLSVPSYDNPLWPPVWKAWTYTLGRRWQHAHDHRFDLSRLIMALQENGFRNIKKRRTFFGLISVIVCRRMKP